MSSRELSLKTTFSYSLWCPYHGQNGHTKLLLAKHAERYTEMGSNLHSMSHQDCPSIFKLPETHFQHSHVDVVGSRPPSDGYTHLQTCANLFISSPQATPLKDTATSSVIQALLHSWTSVYGITATTTTDHRAQFTSTLFRDLMRSLGCNHIIPNILPSCF